MTDLRKAAQQALEALENCNSGHGHRCSRCDMKIDGDGRVVATLKAALAEPQEPVGWFESPHGDFRTNPLYKMEFPSKLLKWQIPLFITPPQRKPLMDEQIDAISQNLWIGGNWKHYRLFARVIERAHGIGGEK